jgi:sulfatase maturation enzyme AslB (radical SAM superfamily)
LTVPREDLRGVTLLIAGRCNLACEYCYQDRRRGAARMSWPTARAALDSVLRPGGPEVRINVSGGEPLLEPALLRRILGFLHDRSEAGACSAVTVTTNGTLLTPEILEFLVRHDARLDLSCDGTPAAQARRGAGTSARLEWLLEHLTRTHPEYLRSNVRVGVTLTAATIPCLADGVRYLLARDVATIRVGACLTPDAGWSEARRLELEGQLAEVVDLSVSVWERHGTIPVTFLAAPPSRQIETPGDGCVCGAPLGRTLCVDTGGVAWGCPLFASSLHELPPLARRAARALCFGRVDGGAVAARLARPESGTPRAFTHKLAKRSSYARCGDCPWASECFVCPAAICLAGDAADPDVIPDFQCAFNRAVFAARRSFAERTAGGVERAWMDGVKAALRGVRDALAKALPVEQAAPDAGVRGAP